MYVNALASASEWHEELVISSSYVKGITARVHTLIPDCYCMTAWLTSVKYTNWHGGLGLITGYNWQVVVKMVH